MIKFKTNPGKNGKCMIGLGLSAENMIRLLSDQPILVTPGQLFLGDGFDGVEKIAIFGGKDEKEMQDRLLGVFDVREVDDDKKEALKVRASARSERRSDVAKLEQLCRRFVHFDDQTMRYSYIAAESIGEDELAHLTAKGCDAL